MEVDGMEVIKGHWDFTPGEKKNSKNFKGAQKGHFKNGHFGLVPHGGT